MLTSIVIIEEVWKDIGIGKYQVSDEGRVRNKNNHIMKQNLSAEDGYFQLSLYHNKKQIHKQVHRLVAETFIQNPKEKPFVNHKDGDKLNNCVENLEWMTESENTFHSIYSRKSTVRREINQYTPEGIFIKKWNSIAEASRELNIYKARLSDCLRERYGKDRILEGSKWKYADERKPKEKITNNGGIWKTIELFPNYKISSKGQVKNSKTNNFISIHINKNYLTVSLRNNEIRKNVRVHRLVAQTFISNISNHTIINHKDGNKLNNCVENLEWTTRKENCRHAYNMGLSKPTNEKPVIQYDLEGNPIKEYKSIAEASRQAKCDKKIIGLICRGKVISSKGFIWKYKNESF